MDSSNLWILKSVTNLSPALFYPWRRFFKKAKIKTWNVTYNHYFLRIVLLSFLEQKFSRKHFYKVTSEKFLKLKPMYLSFFM